MNNTQSADIFSLPDGYAPQRKTTPTPTVMVRRMSLREILATSGHVEFVANDGTLRRLKINGRIKTWKRDPSRIEVSVKYGLYEYGRMDTEEALRRLVVRVPDGSDDND
jgi:hypothetical protein